MDFKDQENQTSQENPLLEGISGDALHNFEILKNYIHALNEDVSIQLQNINNHFNIMKSRYRTNVYQQVIKLLIDYRIFAFLFSIINQEFSSRDTLNFLHLIKRLIKYISSEDKEKFLSPENLVILLEWMHQREHHAKYYVCEILIQALEDESIAINIINKLEALQFDELCQKLIMKMPEVSFSMTKEEALRKKKYEYKFEISFLDLMQLIFSYLDEQGIAAFIPFLNIIVQLLPNSSAESVSIEDRKRSGEILPIRPMFPKLYYRYDCLLFMYAFKCRPFIDQIDLNLLISRLLTVYNEIPKDSTKDADNLWVEIVSNIDLEILPIDFYNILADKLLNKSNKSTYRIVDLIFEEVYPKLEEYEIINVLFTNISGYEFKSQIRSWKVLSHIMKTMYAQSIASNFAELRVIERLASRMEHYNNEIQFEILTGLISYIKQDEQFAELLRACEDFGTYINEVALESEDDEVCAAANELQQILFPEE